MLSKGFLHEFYQIAFQIKTYENFKKISVVGYTPTTQDEPLGKVCCGRKRLHMTTANFSGLIRIQTESDLTDTLTNLVSIR